MNNSDWNAVIETDCCRIGLQLECNQLVSTEYLPDTVELLAPQDDVTKYCVSEILHYFADARYPFRFDLNPNGTEFQQSVWRALCNIPSGETRTYGQLAKQLGTSARAVGNACRANPLPLVIPCHRVVAANGLGGFSGQREGFYPAIKKRLLQHEGLEID